MLTVAEFREAVRRVRGPAVRCPYCVGSLRQPQATVVIASRHCPHCGRRVLVEPADQGEPTLTAEDVSVLRARECRFQQRLMWPAAVAFLGMPLVVLVFALFQDTLLAVFAPGADEQTVKDGVGGLMIASLLICFGWMVVLTLRAERQGGRCPHCSANLWQRFRLLAATGNCGRCGGRVADRPPAAPADPPPRPIADVLAARSARVGWSSRRSAAPAAAAASWPTRPRSDSGGRRRRVECGRPSEA